MVHIKDKKLKLVLIQKCKWCHKTRVDPDGLSFCHKCIMNIAKKSHKEFKERLRKKFETMFD